MIGKFDNRSNNEQETLERENVEVSLIDAMDR